MTKPTLEQLRGACRGQVVARDDPGYEVAGKLYNGMIDRRPAHLDFDPTAQLRRGGRLYDHHSMTPNPDVVQRDLCTLLV